MTSMQGKQQRRCLAIVLAFLSIISLWGISNLHPPVAHAMSQENNGVGLTPALGWSSWSFVRHNPTATGIEAQAACEAVLLTRRKGRPAAGLAR